METPLLETETTSPSAGVDAKEEEEKEREGEGRPEDWESVFHVRESEASEGKRRGESRAEARGPFAVREKTEDQSMKEDGKRGREREGDSSGRKR